MRFGRVPLVSAQGAILAHTRRLPGRVLKKGAVLDAGAVAALAADGVADVIAAQLDEGDVPEDEAARRLAAALVSPGLQASPASTGRVNLVATSPGLVQVDRAALDRINGLDESLTVGTLPDAAPVAARDMVATIKVIPFAAPETALRRAEAAAQEQLPLRLHPFHALRVGLVMTTLPGLKASILDGTAAATAARVAGLTGTMLPPLTCNHDEAEIATALQTLMADGADLLLVAGASAVVDRRDVGPAGIVAAGGRVLYFGMPVDPGNLICLCAIGDRPALVLPGCARSPRLNGIDWVLARLFAGLPVDGRVIAGMGAGGLLQDPGQRPLPRAKAAGTPDRGGVAGIVLAAGRSSRMAPHNKLLVMDREGRAMVARVVDNLLASTARPVLVVLGHRADDVRAALAGRDVRFVPAPDYAAGLSASLRAGIAAVPPGAGAALVCLGDMPLVTGGMMQQVIAAYDPGEGRGIVAPTCLGKIGNPVLWGRRFFPDIAGLTGDMGARPLLERHQEHVALVELGDDAVLRDFDTVDSLESLPDEAFPGTALSIV